MANIFISNFQFSAAVIMLLLTMTLALTMFRRVRLQNVLNTARWLMALGTGILFLQFLLQYTLRLRDMGHIQALMLNLLMFVPAAWMLSLALLYLQKCGKLTKLQWCEGGLIWLAVIAMLVVATIDDGLPFFCDTPAVRLAEKISAIVFFCSRCHYMYMQYMELRRTLRSLDNYYDYDTSDKLCWMLLSIIWMLIMSVTNPIAIFFPGRYLIFYGFFALAGIYYFVMSFRDYAISHHALQVMEAQQNATDAGMDDDEECCEIDMSEEEKRHTEHAVNAWIERGGHLRAGVTMSMVAAETNITQISLRNWFHITGYKSYPEWIQAMRIDHAKRLMHDHPNFSIETISEQCGFSSRNYFQTIFKKHEGITPIQYMCSMK